MLPADPPVIVKPPVSNWILPSFPAHPGGVTVILFWSITRAKGVFIWTVESFPFSEQLLASFIPIWYWKPGVILTVPPPGILFASPSENVWDPKVAGDLPISVPPELYKI